MGITMKTLLIASKQLLVLFTILYSTTVDAEAAFKKLADSVSSEMGSVETEADHIDMTMLDSKVEEGLPPLIELVANYDTDWGELKYMLAQPEGKMNIDTPDKNGWTALMWSIKKQRPTFTQALLEAGADPNKYPSADGRSPLHWAAYLKADNCVYFLVNDPRTEINYRGSKGYSSALIVAVERSHRHIIKMLVRHGADPHLPGLHGRTALDIADEKLKGDILRWAKDAPKVNAVGEKEVRFVLGLSLVFAVFLLLWFSRRCACCSRPAASYLPVTTVEKEVEDTGRETNAVVG